MAKEVVLPSGALLQIYAPPFSEAKALYKAVMAECRAIPLENRASFIDVAKNLICVGASSLLVEQALTKVMARCLYAGSKITDQSFEPENAREDYTMVCAEVLEETIRPFLKNLYAVFTRLLSTVGENPESLSPTTTE